MDEKCKEPGLRDSKCHFLGSYCTTWSYYLRAMKGGPSDNVNCGLNGSLVKMRENS